MHSQFVPGGAPIDLTNCDREPIHTPGSIQPHGALLAIDPATERILAASANCAEFIGSEPRQIVNALASDVLGARGADALRAAFTVATSSRSAAAIPLSRADVRASVQRVGDTVYLEIEPHEHEPAGIVAATRDAVRAFVDIGEVAALCAAGAAELRAITGYDRVMIYRFDPDGHGHVIAEARAEHLEAFLGRHYPASDIPRQARALYRTTMIRLIVDVASTPAPLIPLHDPRTGAEWDLGNAILRSSSPIHLQYLKNMGVTATMTVSLLRDGELWGLIACHHYAPKFATADVRYATETAGHALVARIVQLEDARIFAAQIAVRDAVLAFVGRAGAGGAVSLATDLLLHEAMGVHGAAFVNGSITSAGRVPDEAHIARLIAWLAERDGTDRFTTDALAKLNPSFEEIADVASGVYAQRVPGGWFVAFRGEDVQTVDWGGDPAKPAETGDGERLSPRGSFALWREEVRQRATPWEPWITAALERALAFSHGGTTA